MGRGDPGAAACCVLSAGSERPRGGAAGPERANLEAALECRSLFAALPEASEPLQTLQMQAILPQIANTFAYWALVREGLDQAAAGTRRKLATAELFHRMYLAEEYVDWDEAHLEPIAQITDAAGS